MSQQEDTSQLIDGDAVPEGSDGPPVLPEDHDAAAAVVEEDQ